MTMMDAPMTMTGHCRNFMQSVLLARLLSQIPPARIGIERRKVRNSAARSDGCSSSSLQLSFLSALLCFSLQKYICVIIFVYVSFVLELGPAASKFELSSDNGVVIEMQSP
ncbi:hypothetical protein NMG60_11015763 [Bertholletia excelsa]